MDEVSRVAFIPPPFDLEVSCSGEVHRVEVREGVPHATAHQVEELALEALGGTPPECIRHTRIVRDAPQLVALDAQYNMQSHGATVMVADLLPVALSSRYRVADAMAVPPSLRRVAMLLSKLDEAKRHPSIREYVTALIRRWVGRRGPHSVNLSDLELTVGDIPALHLQNARSTAAVLQFPLDWLAIVLGLGWETVRGGVTIGASIRGQNAVLHVLSRRNDGIPWLRVETARTSELSPGIHVLV